MTNVFTRQSKLPRSTTLRDFCGHEVGERVKLPMLMRNNRMCNPHPDGLIYQQICDVAVSIWNPNFHKHVQMLPTLLENMERENFSCGKLRLKRRELGKPPDIKYTESTISRRSFTDPNKLPAIKDNLKTTRFAYTPRVHEIRGIVPT